MKSLFLVLLASLAGCAGSGDGPPSATDPANPAAPETAWAPPPDRLSGPVEPLADEKPPEGATWTCPMHPEVKSAKAGACPKCGMDLQPVKEAPAGEHKGHDHK
ncbi:MAG: Cu2+-exporting [Planctomycetota bacterium]|nr:MAG: Cu2+-exporting [Planctomycetota bacterium]